MDGEPPITTWPEFRRAFRQALLFNGAVDAVACDLRCNEPPKVHVEARVRMQYESGMAISLWERDAGGPTFQALFVGLLTEFQEILKATAHRARELHFKNTRIVQAVEMPPIVGEDGRGRRRR